ncbi:hypothetical protein QTG54_005332 [Skeletonema marinoi]|uniref:Uncharacterized protein n=1 Tax=Skeletonema marinoi TaxID=267567 RepID=A0AAD8YEZ3_9STRA|nr:hypothetical protein QTG54_005332 [Skeletonema marinoi]
MITSKTAILLASCTLGLVAAATVGTFPAFVHPHQIKKLKPSTYAHHDLQQIRRSVSLSSTTAKDTNDPAQQQYNVLYQKVLRAPKDAPSQMFLLNLVSYLQQVFELPSDLPMPYDTAVPENGDEMAPPETEHSNPLDAYLEVEVVGIFPDDADLSMGPTMAMVALKKNKGDGANSPTQGLFAASEKRIVQSLDRGLQDLEEGRVSVPDMFDDDDSIDFSATEDDGVAESVKRIGYQNSVDAASAKGVKKENKKINKPIEIERDALGNVIIESETLPTAATESTSKPKREQSVKQKKESSIPTKSQSNPKPQISKNDEDYAIKMARQQAEALMTTVSIGKKTSSSEGTISISGGESDFAIQAAKKAAERMKSKPHVEKGTEVKNANKTKEAVSKSKAASRQEPQKAKVQDLSSDEMFMKLQKLANKSNKTSWNRTIANKKTQTSESSSSKPMPTEQMAAENEKTDEEIRDDIKKIAQQNEQVQELLRSATDMMPIENDEEEGLSPEDLLAEGAFDKAKDLLRSDESDSRSQPELRYEDDEMKQKAEEEELRRIFAAGQSVAEDKLSAPMSTESNLVRPSITEENIDELIDSDETVSRNARVLEDELAELEVRMSRSQGETGSNKVFDVFSGPETYNPNVDPETAVNWPGAKEGTRTDVRLANALSTALKQAKFAAAVLSQLREEEGSNDEVKYFVGEKEISAERVALLQACVKEAVNAGIIEDPLIIMAERSRLQMLVDELMSQPQERLEEIAMNYKDLLLSDNLVELMKERLQAMAQRDLEARRRGDEDAVSAVHATEHWAGIGQGCAGTGAELEVSMLEIIRSICEVAMDPSHKTEEDTAVALKDAVRDMRPLLDDAFVAYLKYAIGEEQGRLAREGVLDDPEHNRWLFVLQIVQEGVYAELSQGVKRYVDHIWYVLRMKSKTERKELLKKLIDVMPTMDVRPFVKVVNNIVSSLGTTVKGDFSDGVILGEMSNQLLQLRRDVDELLPPDRIKELSKDADAWAAVQRQRLIERRNMTRQRLEAARNTGDIDPEKYIKKPGAEAERFD